MIFSQDITTNGNNRRIPFTNREFQGDISTTATEGAQIILEPGLVPYEKQDPNYYCVVQWWASGKKVMFVECEYDPQKGDALTTISAEDQQAQTVAAMQAFINP